MTAPGPLPHVGQNSPHGKGVDGKLERWYNQAMAVEDSERIQTMAMSAELREKLVNKLEGADLATYAWLHGRKLYYLYSDALNTMAEDYKMAQQYEAVLQDFLSSLTWKYFPR